MPRITKRGTAAALSRPEPHPRQNPAAGTLAGEIVALINLRTAAGLVEPGDAVAALIGVFRVAAIQWPEMTVGAALTAAAVAQELCAIGIEAETLALDAPQTPFITH
jgi:hypothetical protein